MNRNKEKYRWARNGLGCVGFKLDIAVLEVVHVDTDSAGDVVTAVGDLPDTPPASIPVDNQVFKNIRIKKNKH